MIGILLADIFWRFDFFDFKVRFWNVFWWFWMMSSFSYLSYFFNIMNVFKLWYFLWSSKTLFFWFLKLRYLFCCLRLYSFSLFNCFKSGNSFCRFTFSNFLSTLFFFKIKLQSWNEFLWLRSVGLSDCCNFTKDRSLFNYLRVVIFILCNIEFYHRLIWIVFKILLIFMELITCHCLNKD